MTDAKLERDAVEAFAREDVLERLVFFAGRPKRRGDLLHVIHTSKFLAPNALVPVSPAAFVGSHEAGVAELMKQMSKLGAGGTCYAISLLSKLDGRTLPLGAALEECFMNTVETLLFDPESRIGYFEGGHASDRFVLRAVRPRAL